MCGTQGHCRKECLACPGGRSVKDCLDRFFLCLVRSGVHKNNNSGVGHVSRFPLRGNGICIILLHLKVRTLEFFQRRFSMISSRPNDCQLLWKPQIRLSPPPSPRLPCHNIPFPVFLFLENKVFSPSALLTGLFSWFTSSLPWRHVPDYISIQHIRQLQGTKLLYLPSPLLSSSPLVEKRLLERPSMEKVYLQSFWHMELLL
jgi:hypothetical protein